MKEWSTYHALVHRRENITTLLAELVDKSDLPRREVRESELVQTKKSAQLMVDRLLAHGLYSSFGNVDAIDKAQQPTLSKRPSR